MIDAVSIPPLSVSYTEKSFSWNSEFQTWHREVIWNSTLKGRTRQSIREGKAGPVFISLRVWVWRVCREDDRSERERERVLPQRNFCEVTGHDPELCMHILLDIYTLTPYQLSYRPPSQPDRNSMSDPHTGTPNYIYVAGERMKRLDRSL